MSGSKSYSGLVTVCGDYEGGQWSLTSPDLPGFFLRGPSLEKLHGAVPEAVTMLYLLNYGMKVSVTQAVPADQFTHPERIIAGHKAIFTALPIEQHTA